MTEENQNIVNQDCSYPGLKLRSSPNMKHEMPTNNFGGAACYRFKIPSGMRGKVYKLLIVKHLKEEFRDEWINFYSKSTNDF
jgi:hypothetical protein